MIFLRLCCDLLSTQVLNKKYFFFIKKCYKGEKRAREKARKKEIKRGRKEKKFNTQSTIIIKIVIFHFCIKHKTNKSIN